MKNLEFPTKFCILTNSVFQQILNFGKFCISTNFDRILYFDKFCISTNFEFRQILTEFCISTRMTVYCVSLLQCSQL